MSHKYELLAKGDDAVLLYKNGKAVVKDMEGDTLRMGIFNSVQDIPEEYYDTALHYSLKAVHDEQRDIFKGWMSNNVR